MIGAKAPCCEKCSRERASVVGAMSSGKAVRDATGLTDILNLPDEVILAASMRERSQPRCVDCDRLANGKRR